MSEMREITLTQGKVAIVSVEDCDYLMQWKWHTSDSHGFWYAKRSTRIRVIDGSVKRMCVYMHRVVLARVLGHEDFQQVDHIDGDGLNNQRDNLRPVTNKQNQENRQPPRNNYSGVRGVRWDKKARKWAAYIYHNGKQINLGSFDGIYEAEQAAIAARNEHFTHHRG